MIEQQPVRVRAAAVDQLQPIVARSVSNAHRQRADIIPFGVDLNIMKFTLQCYRIYQVGIDIKIRSNPIISEYKNTNQTIVLHRKPNR